MISCLICISAFEIGHQNGCGLIPCLTYPTWSHCIQSARSNDNSTIDNNPHNTPDKAVYCAFVKNSLTSKCNIQFHETKGRQNIARASYLSFGNYNNGKNKYNTVLSSLSL